MRVQSDFVEPDEAGIRIFKPQGQGRAVHRRRLGILWRYLGHISKQAALVAGVQSRYRSGYRFRSHSLSVIPLHPDL
jgi:hypothetical protein